MILGYNVSSSPKSFKYFRWFSNQLLSSHCHFNYFHLSIARLISCLIMKAFILHSAHLFPRTEKNKHCYGSYFLMRFPSWAIIECDRCKLHNTISINGLQTRLHLCTYFIFLILKSATNVRKRRSSIIWLFYINCSLIWPPTNDYRRVKIMRSSSRRLINNCVIIFHIFSPVGVMLTSNKGPSSNFSNMDS